MYVNHVLVCLFHQIQAVLKKYDILLIADEVTQVYEVKGE